MTLRRVSLTPRLYLHDELLDDDARAALIAAIDGLADRGLPLEPGEHGAWRDLQPEQLPGLDAALLRLREVIGWPDEARPVARVRDYRAGQGHPPHEDRYEIGDQILYATALIVLIAPDAGGETRFPEAHPTPLAIEPRPGRLTLWYGLTPDGLRDRDSRHDAAPVEAGRKLTLTVFLYGPPDARHLEGPRAIRRFVFVDDGVPVTTRRLLRVAAIARGLDWRAAEAATWDFDDARRLRPGDLLYRAAVSSRAAWVQQHLYGPGVRTFFASPHGPFSAYSNASWRLQRAGVPVPDTLPVTTSDRRALRRLAARLGLPLVLKHPGGEGGVGTLRADSLAALFSLADHARGGLLLALRYLPDTTCWRAVVVGDHTVAAYPNPIPADDFRSAAPADPAAYRTPWPAGLAELAVRATHALDLRMGGVDVLVAPDGALWVLEVNFPCYFGHAQEEGGVDVAGAMVDALLALP